MRIVRKLHPNKIEGVRTKVDTVQGLRPVKDARHVHAHALRLVYWPRHRSKICSGRGMMARFGRAFITIMLPASPISAVTLAKPALERHDTESSLLFFRPFFKQRARARPHRMSGQSTLC